MFTKYVRRHMIACLVRDVTLLARVKDYIFEEMFETEQERGVVALIVDFFENYGVVPSEAFLRDATDDHKFVRSLYKEDISDAPAVRDKILDFARFRRWQTVVFDCAKEIAAINERRARDPNLSVDDGVARVMARIEDAKEKDAIANLQDLGSFLVGDDLDARIQQYLYPETLPTVATGMRHLDAAINGGLHPGELGVILAPAKRGKSFFLVNIGVGAVSPLQRLKVVHYSLEMGATHILRRYDSRLTGKKGVELGKSAPKYVQYLRRRIDLLVRGNVCVKEAKTRSMGRDDIIGHMTELRASGFKPDLIIVDYGDIMKPMRRTETRREREASCFEDLRFVAQEFQVPVWTATQANRSSLSKPLVTMEHVSESFEKVQIADAIVAICRTPEEIETDRGRLFLAGVRNAQDNRVIDCEMQLRYAKVKTLNFVVETKTKARETKDVDDQIGDAVKRGQRRRNGSRNKKRVA